MKKILPSNYEPKSLTMKAKEQQDNSDTNNPKPDTYKTVLEWMNYKQMNRIAREVNPSFRVDKPLAKALFEIKSDFIDTVMNGACLMAQHREETPSKIEGGDVALYLEKAFNIPISDFGFQEVPAIKQSTNEIHKKRLELRKQALEKNRILSAPQTVPKHLVKNKEKGN